MNKTLPKTIALLSLAETMLGLDDSIYTQLFTATVKGEGYRLRQVGKRKEVLRMAVKYAKRMADYTDLVMSRRDIYPFIYAHELVGVWYGEMKLQALPLYHWPYIDVWEDARKDAGPEIVDLMGKAAADAVELLKKL